MNKLELKVRIFFNRLRHFYRNTDRSYLTIHLINGKSKKVTCDDGEYEWIYDSWSEGNDDILAFDNCCVHAKNVLMIEYR